MSYCIVSLVAGQAGFLAARDLGNRIGTMKERIADLESDNLTLRTAAESLQYDADRIAREARDLGYVKPGEKIIVMSDMPSTAGSRTAPVRKVEEILPIGISSGLPDEAVKILALVTGVAVLVASFVLRSKPRKAKSSPQPEAAGG